MNIIYIFIFFSPTERILGGLDIFLPYIKDYVETFIGKSITTEQWKEHLYAYFSKHGGSEKIKALDGVDWDVCLFLTPFDSLK
jgi:leukotriene-A4 hydrolase